jgi:hypothetical protein
MIAAGAKRRLGQDLHVRHEVIEIGRDHGVVDTRRIYRDTDFVLAVYERSAA